jgi:hypothetical protein
MRHHAKVDGNHRAIVDAARKLGAFVTSLADVGGGTPDLLIIHAGKVALYEVKDGALPPSKRKLTPDEELWHTKAKMIGGYTVPVVESIEDVVRELTSAASSAREDGPACSPDGTGLAAPTVKQVSTRTWAEW